ncbi:hypothetical protein ACHAQA_009543 [Verticillium albo-atrum]
MDSRASHPVSLPVLSPTKSYWQDPPDEIADHSSGPIPTTADVVIVGSGITGAAIALNLLKQAETASQYGAPEDDRLPKVVMLEARQACSGATGRNGGHTKAASYRSFLDNAQRLGTAVACQIARLELNNIRAVHAFAQEHSISCESNPCQTVDAIYDAAQWTQACSAIEAMRKAMPDEDASRYQIHTAEELREAFFVGGDSLFGGVEYEAGSISAYRFTIGVLKQCLALGLHLQANTPALSISRTGDAGTPHPWLIETPNGTIRTSRVVLATNGYTASLHPRLHRVIVPVRGHVTAQRPGLSMPKEGLTTTYSFIYANGYDYMVPRSPPTHYAGDIVIGGGLVRPPEEGLEEYGTTDDATLNPIITNYLHDSTPRYFGTNWGPDHQDGRIRQAWTGIMGFSPDGLPFVGEMPGEEGLWMAAGFQGHGMVLCWMCAQALAVMMSGRDGRELQAWFPEAFRISEQRLQLRFERVSHAAGDGSTSDKRFS